MNIVDHGHLNGWTFNIPTNLQLSQVAYTCFFWRLPRQNSTVVTLLCLQHVNAKPWLHRGPVSVVDFTAASNIVRDIRHVFTFTFTSLVSLLTFTLPLPSGGPYFTLYLYTITGSLSAAQPYDRKPQQFTVNT